MLNPTGSSTSSNSNTFNAGMEMGGGVMTSNDDFGALEGGAGAEGGSGSFSGATSSVHSGLTSNRLRSEETVVNFSSSMIPALPEIAQLNDMPLLGFLLTPLVPLQPSPPGLRRKPVRCENCLAIIHKWSTIKGSEWTCNFCHAVQSLPEVYDPKSLSHFPELQVSSVEYIDEQGVSASSNEKTMVFVVDEATPIEEQKNYKTSVLQTVSQLPSDTKIGMVSFSNVCNVYALGASGVCSSDVIGGLEYVQYEDMENIFANIDEYLVPALSCLDNIRTILDALFPSSEEEEGNSKEARKRRRQRRKRRHLDEQNRCFGTAMEVSVGLVSGKLRFAEDAQPATESSGSQSTNSGHGLGGRVVAALTGLSNYGMGAILGEANTKDFKFYGEFASEYFKGLGMFANQHNVVVDVHCCGPKDFHTQIMQPLTEWSGGSMQLRRDFAAERFANDILLANEYNCGTDANLLVRCSEPVELTQIIGKIVPDFTPAKGMDDSMWKEQKQDQEEGNGSSVLVRIGSANMTDCFTFFYQLGEETVAENLYFQFCVSFTNANLMRVMRVVTYQMKTTAKKEQFVDSINVDELGVLMGKLSVLNSRKDDDIDNVMDELDGLAYCVATQLGSYNQSTGMYHIPSSLRGLARMLYLLRRGPLLGPILQHPDDIDCMRVQFLSMDLTSAHRLIKPLVYWVYMLDDGNIGMEQIPPEDLALQSDKVVMMDHQSELFVWSGSDIVSSDFNELREAAVNKAMELSQDRVPQCTIHNFKQGDSMSRYLLCRMVPLHKDSKEKQQLGFPVISDLSPEQMQKLLKQFAPNDAPSFYEWLGELGVNV